MTLGATGETTVSGPRIGSRSRDRRCGDGRSPRDSTPSGKRRRTTMARKVDAVFEGGGVKGIALIGAAQAVEEAGYAFENLAGTSAGAIVATLLAAGYSSAELRTILM